VLAKTMGLYQTHAASGGVCQEEARERLKVFGSLYLRDKSLSISRGSICWIPSFDCSLSVGFAKRGSASSNNVARVQLARLQEEVYQSLHSEEPHGLSPAKGKKSLSHIRRSLERWANDNDIFSSVSKNARDVSLQLEFLATRTSALYGSPEPSHVRQALNDSRASCLLLLVSYGKYDGSMIERIEGLLLSKGQTKRPGKTTSPELNNRSKDSSPNNAGEDTGESLPLWFYNLLDAFPAPAFFLLAKNIIWPVPLSDQSPIEDLDLLQKVCTCYKDFNGEAQAKSYTSKVGRAFERLIRVIDLIKDSQATTHQTYIPLNTQKIFGEPQNSSCFPNTSGASKYPMPPTFWGDFSAKSVSTTAKCSERTVSRTSLRTQMEPPYMAQTTEPPRQRPFSTHFQQEQTMSPHGRKRPRVSEPNLSTDSYPDSRLLFGFLAANPMMPSDFMSQGGLANSTF
jgi:hypothetical protein